MEILVRSISSEFQSRLVYLLKYANLFLFIALMANCYFAESYIRRRESASVIPPSNLALGNAAGERNYSHPAMLRASNYPIDGIVI